MVGGLLDQLEEKLVDVTVSLHGLVQDRLDQEHVVVLVGLGLRARLLLLLLVRIV